MCLESGDQKGCLAPSVLSSFRQANESMARTHNAVCAVVPEPLWATNTIARPSGEIAIVPESNELGNV